MSTSIRPMGSPGEMKGLLPQAGTGRIKTPASTCQLLKTGLFQFGKAVFWQGVAAGTATLARSLVQQVYHDTHDSPWGTTIALTVTAGCLVNTLAFDQLVSANTIHKMRCWIGTKNGVPGEPSTLGSHALAVVPTLVTAALVMREMYGDGHEQVTPMLLALDMAGLLWGWRAGRLARDLGQNRMSECLPTLKIVDMDTGEDLTPQQKKTFDDTRLGWQTVLYAGVVMIGAVVTVPALRLVLGADERSSNAYIRTLALLAPVFNTMLVEGADEWIGIGVQRYFAPRQGLEVQVQPGQPKPDWVEQAFDNGGLRAVLGFGVSELAQLLISSDRSNTVLTNLGTAIAVIAIAVMEVRGKSVTVHRDYAANTEAFKNIVSGLIAVVEKNHGVTLNAAQREKIHEDMCALAEELNKRGGPSRPFSSGRMLIDFKDQRFWLDSKQRTVPLTLEQQKDLDDMRGNELNVRLGGPHAYLLKTDGASWGVRLDDSKDRKEPIAPGDDELAVVIDDNEAMSVLNPGNFDNPSARNASIEERSEEQGDGPMIIHSPLKSALSPRRASIEMQREGAEKPGTLVAENVILSGSSKTVDWKKLQAGDAVDVNFSGGITLEGATFKSFDDPYMYVEVLGSARTEDLPVVQSTTAFKTLKVLVRS